MSKFKPGNKGINSPRRKSEPFTAREGPSITPGMLITLAWLTCQNTGGRQIFKAKSWPRSNISSQVLCPEVAEEIQIYKYRYGSVRQVFAQRLQSHGDCPCTDGASGALWLHWVTLTLPVLMDVDRNSAPCTGSVSEICSGGVEEKGKYAKYDRLILLF